MGKLDGRTVLITGGARGQGRSHALMLAREGADIALLDIAAPLPSIPYPLATEEELYETARLVEGEGRSCLAVKADVAKADEVDAVVQRTIREFGRIDSLVANAGVFSGGVPAWELSEEEWDVGCAVNLKGVWLSCKYVIPHMLSRGSGAIVLISSLAGLEGYRNCAHYVAAKHGVIGLMRALANELGEFGIRVNAICPTTVSTASVHNPFIYNLFAGGSGGTVEHIVEGMKKINLLPVGLLDPKDVSRAVLWLLSDEARYVTGLALPVDAGASVRFGA